MLSNFKKWKIPENSFSFLFHFVWKKSKYIFHHMIFIIVCIIQTKSAMNWSKATNIFLSRSIVKFKFSKENFNVAVILYWPYSDKKIHYSTNRNSFVAALIGTLMRNLAPIKWWSWNLEPEHRNFDLKSISFQNKNHNIFQRKLKAEAYSLEICLIR